MRRVLLGAVALVAASATPSRSLFAQDGIETVIPSVADPRVMNYDDADLIFNGGPATRTAPLVVFMPGTGGGLQAPLLLLRTVAGQGYRVIYLPYDDTPAVAQVCPPRPPQCSGRFRAVRVFGGDGPVSNPPAEGIVSRLTAVLNYLERTHPEAGWSDYLIPAGGPAWPRIVVSGLSQGAGMAAFIAKHFPVQRVVLFSSPWDAFGPSEQPAPWLFEASATPPDRWWAERHARENTTQLLARAYSALGIPQDHLLLFNGSLPPNAHGQNPYHGSTVYWPAYLPQWREMFGQAAITSDSPDPRSGS